MNRVPAMRSGRWTRLTSAGVISALAFALIGLTAPPASADTVTSAGPLTGVTITPDLNCKVEHAGDTASEFYRGTACGTFFVTGSKIYAPADIPAGNAGHITFTTVSQNTSGSGSSASPYVITTVVGLGDSGLTITQKDTYIVGQESYRTDTTVTNNGGATVAGNLYKAGDCYLQNSDVGFGDLDTRTGSVSCVAVNDDQTRGTRIEQFYPLSSGSHNFESGYDAVWDAVDAGTPLPDTCLCDTALDNGMALSWTLSLAPGASATRSHLTTFSPLGVEPLSTTKTANSATAQPSTSDGYTITIHNPNSVTEQVATVTDTLPAGFTYLMGSSLGPNGVIADPTISGRDLTWTGPFPVSGGGDLVLRFFVEVSKDPGIYYNNAGGTSADVAIAPTGDTAPITVTAPANRAPSANAQSVSTPRDTAKPVTLSGSDPDGDGLTYAVVAGSGPSHGSLSGTAPNLVYTPAAGYVGADEFKFTVSDGQATSSPATVSITVTAPAGCTATAPTVDQTAYADQNRASTTLSVNGVFTSGPGRLIIALIQADGPQNANGQRVLSVSGGGLTWTNVRRANSTWGTAEVWQAYASATVPASTIKATLSAAYNGSITVGSFARAGSQVGASVAAVGTSGAPSVQVTPAAACGSLIYGSGHDWTRNTMVTPVAGQSFVHAYADTRVHDVYWSMRADSATSDRTPVTLKVTGPRTDRWQMVGVEIPPAA